MENIEKVENEVPSDIDDESSQKVLSLSKRQLKALGLGYKKELTEKQKAHNQKMSEYWKKYHEDERKKKEAYEAQQVAQLQQKITVKAKPKQKYVTKKYDISLEDEDSEELREYQEFQKYKIARKKQPKPKKEESEDEKDGYIQKKTQKATEILETVSKLDSAINKLNSTNPYLGLFNKK
jgi:hypothetical protein